MRALSFGPSPSDGPVAAELTLDNTENLLRLKQEEMPRVFVIRQVDLKALRNLGDRILDLKQKDKRVELPRYFLRVADQNTPILEVFYVSAARLQGSIRALLTKAFEQAKRNVYFLGVAESLFTALLAETEKRRDKAGTCPPPQKRPKKHVRGAERLRPYASTLALLQKQTVPPDLAKKYVGEAPEVEMVRQFIVLASKSLEPVLIEGETGTGKEIVAKAIHDLSVNESALQAKPFRAINCGEISRDLIASELFGHTAQAFTGARFAREGLWVSANNGTLFLDEIGDMPWSFQVSLLRGLQEKEVRPVGSDETVKVNARIIAATNRDLLSMVQRKQFREDLYFRLCTLYIPTPALRDHPEDIPLIARHLWAKIPNQGIATQLPEDLLNALKAYPWAGNVRLLRTALHRLYALFGPEHLGLQHLNDVMQHLGQTPGAGPESGSKNPIDLHRIDCLCHLRKAEATVRRTKVTLRALTAEKQTPSETPHTLISAVTDRIRELDRLCRYPSLFYAVSTFEAVYQLKGKLMYLQDVLGENLAEARKYYAREIKGHYDLSVAAICTEIRQVLNDYDRNSHDVPFSWPATDRAN